MNRKTIIYIIISVVLLGAGISLILLGRRRNNEREDRYEAVKEIIEKDLLTSQDAKDEDQALLMLQKQQCDGSYLQAADDADQLIDARGNWVSQDNDAQVFEVLADKTQNQIACINQALESRYGESLLEFINDIFGELWDGNKRERAFRMIGRQTGKA